MDASQQHRFGYVMQNDYQVIYRFADNTYQAELRRADKPDIETMELPEGIVGVTIRAPFPLEHSLVNEELPDADEWFEFPSVYFLHAHVISFTEALRRINEKHKPSLYRSAQQAVAYGCRYAGRPIGTQPEDMRFIHAPLIREIHCFQDNYAVLAAVTPPPADGTRRRRITNLTLDGQG